MKPQTVTYQFYRVLEDKSEQELAILTMTAPSVKVVIVSQYIDLRTPDGETFSTVTFPSWVRVRKIGG